MSDLWSSLVVAEQQDGHLKDVFAEVDRLSVNEKAELVKKLLNTPGLTIVFGNNQLSGNIIVQINTTERETLAGILEIIADRISSEG